MTNVPDCLGDSRPLEVADDNGAGEGSGVESEKDGGGGMLFFDERVADAAALFSR